MNSGPEGFAGLIAEVLRGVPRLKGALCIGRHTLFDAEVPRADRQQVADTAAAICWECPVLSQCGRWAGDPKAHVSGVVAGRDMAAE